MSHSVSATLRRQTPALIAGSASFLVLAGIFFATMLRHYQAIDFSYLSFALARILAISLAVALLSTLLARRLQSPWTAGLFGVVSGFALGALFVAIAA